MDKLLHLAQIRLFASPLSEEMLLKLGQYIALLKKWNRVYNLTAAHNVKAIVLEHIVDSLRILTFIKGPDVLDVGSGAGFPGIPLALARPQDNFVLLDSLLKKTRFLNQVKIELGIKNMEVVNQRVETFNPGMSFDTIVTRATFPLNMLIEKAEHLLKVDGQLLAMKGKYPKHELMAIAEKPYRVVVHKLEPLEFVAERHLICLTRSAYSGA